MTARTWLPVLLALALLGCSDDDGPAKDARAGDGGVRDGAARDAGARDVSTPGADARARDGGRTDGASAGDGDTPDGGTAAVPLEFNTTLTGDQESPPVETNARGSATVTLNGARTQLQVVVTFSDLTNITSAHIHVGAPGVPGPVIFPLAAGSFSSPLRVTLTAADLTPQGAQNVESFADAMAAMAAGITFINIHTTRYPAGEIRGQLLAAD